MSTVILFSLTLRSLFAKLSAETDAQMNTQKQHYKKTQKIQKKIGK